MKQYKKNLWFIVFLVDLIFNLWLLYLAAGLFVPLDFSQDYRKVQGYENIVLVRNGRDQCYKRTFWGLEKFSDLRIDNRDNSHESDSSYNQLKDLIDTGNVIRQAIYSPDRKYILFSEIESDYKDTRVTDDEYCYYRVYEIESGKVVTIYQAYREWYNLFWRSG